jgi:hypothetical protein
LHPRADCFELAERRRALSRALRLTTALDVSPVRTFLADLDKTSGDDWSGQEVSAAPE